MPIWNSGMPTWQSLVGNNPASYSLSLTFECDLTKLRGRLEDEDEAAAIFVFFESTKLDQTRRSVLITIVSGSSSSSSQPLHNLSFCRSSISFHHSSQNVLHSMDICSATVCPPLPPLRTHRRQNETKCHSPEWKCSN